MHAGKITLWQKLSWLEHGTPCSALWSQGLWLQIFTKQFAFNYRSRKDWEDFPSGFLSTEANLSKLQPRKHLISGK